MNRFKKLLKIAVLGLLALGCQSGAARKEATEPEFLYVKEYSHPPYSIQVGCYSPDGSMSLTSCRVRISQKKKVLETKTSEVDGQVTGSAVDDLDRDGNFEVLVFSRSAGSGSYGEAKALEWEGGKLRERPLPSLTGQQAKGYMGHDSFEAKDGALVREFPVYRESDPNASPSGGTRRITYRLKNNAWDCASEDSAPGK